MSTATDPDQLVSIFADLIRGVLPAEQSDLFLLDGSPKHPVPLPGRTGSPILKEVEQRKPGALELAATQLKTLVIPVSRTASRGAVTGTYIVLPLVLGKESIGIYVALTHKPPGDFSDKEMDFLAIVANQAAVGICHWRTYQALITADQELKKSQIEMMRAARLAAIGELASDIAHEMTNPLQVTMLHLELIQSGRPLPNWPEMFAAQMKRLSDMTTRLKSFARNVSGEVRMEPVDLNKTLQTSIEIIRHEFEGKGIRFELSYGSNLPRILGNGHYLLQLFLNLLTNAAEAMPDGGKICITTDCSGEKISVRVADTGLGIPDEIQGKIFKPFFSTKGEKSAGLGLSICSKIVLQHSGEMRLESEEGKGAAFRIEFPICSEV
jgi:signal transduction histidine kinase